MHVLPVAAIVVGQGIIGHPRGDDWVEESFPTLNFLERGIVARCSNQLQAFVLCRLQCYVKRLIGVALGILLKEQRVPAAEGRSKPRLVTDP